MFIEREGMMNGKRGKELKRFQMLDRLKDNGRYVGSQRLAENGEKWRETITRPA